MLDVTRAKRDWAESGGAPDGAAGGEGGEGDTMFASPEVSEGGVAL